MTVLFCFFITDIISDTFLSLLVLIPADAAACHRGAFKHMSFKANVYRVQHYKGFMKVVDDVLSYFTNLFEMFLRLNEFSCVSVRSDKISNNPSL